MPKINRKQLSNLLRQAKENNYVKENLKLEKNTEEISKHEVKIDTVKWNHSEGQLGYLKNDYSNHQKNDFLIVIGETYKNRYSRHNCFYVLINSTVENIPGNIFATFD